MKKLSILFICLLILGTISCKKEGCTDPLANNYSSAADKDDGTCEYDVNVISEEITDDITTPTTLAAKTYKICTDIYISSELSIMPGTKIIMCEGSSITVESNGFLNATGTAENPIEIKGEAATKGFWTGISFKSNNPNNKLIHVTISDAGTYWAWEYATVYVSGSAQLSLQNSTIKNSDNYGLFVEDGGLLSSFSENTFSENTTGLSVRADQVSKLDGASIYNDGNIFNYIEVRQGTIAIPQEWKATSSPLLLSNLNIDASLELLPGVNILVAANQGIAVGTAGSLTANGTASTPITIAGKETVAGYWSGLKIDSNSPNNKLAFVTISDGGDYWAYKHANIFVDGQLDIENCTIKNANSYGIYVSAGSSIFANGTLQPNASVVEAHNTFSGNGTGPDANCTNDCTIFFE